jgi:hypothetical protein
MLAKITRGTKFLLAKVFGRLAMGGGSRSSLKAHVR